MPEFDAYFFQRQMWRQDLAKECKQITMFVKNETKNNSRVSLRNPARAGLKVPEPYAGKLALPVPIILRDTVLSGRKLPGCRMLRKPTLFQMTGKMIKFVN